VAVVALRKLLPEKMLILGMVTLAFGVLITLAGVQYQNVGVMLFGTLIGGTGFSTVFSGTRTCWPAVRLFRRGLSFLQPSRACGQASSHQSLVWRGPQTSTASASSCWQSLRSPSRSCGAGAHSHASKKVFIHRRGAFIAGASDAIIPGVTTWRRWIAYDRRSDVGMLRGAMEGKIVAVSLLAASR
jgi:hypothetical protein